MSEQGISPHVAARRVWNERYGDAYAQARNWRLCAFCALAVAAVAVGGDVWQAGQSKVQPYVVEVDKLGDKVAIGRAEQAGKADVRAIRAELARWTMDVFGVSSDPDAESENVNEAYALTDKAGPAVQSINEWFSTHVPYTRAAKGETVVVQVSYVRWRAGDTWIVGWHEETAGHDGQPGTVRDMEAEIVVAVSPPSDEAGIDANPLGIFVETANWGVKR